MPDISSRKLQQKDCDGGDSFAEQAERCRRLARGTHDRSAAQMLEQMAADYEQRARHREY